LAQNVPLFSFEANPNPLAQSINVDLGKLGITRGTSAAGREFSYTIGEFKTLVPTSNFTGSGLVSERNVHYDYAFDLLEAGDDLNNPVVPTGYSSLEDPLVVDMGAAPGPTILPQVPPVPNPVQVLRPKMVGIEQTPNGCGPGAAANSIFWLHNRFGLDTKGMNANQLYQYFYNEMKTDANTGTTPANFFAGKEAFAQGTNMVTKKFLGNVTWAWIEQEFDHQEDVELFFNWWGKVVDKAGNVSWRWFGHATTIMGKFDGGPGNRWLWLLDDQDQRNPGGLVPRLTRVGEGTQYPGSLSLLREGKYTYVWGAVSQSVPEPATMGLLALSLAGLTRYIRRRLRA